MWSEIRAPTFSFRPLWQMDAATKAATAHFGYAAAMKSLNNLLLLGDGET